MRANRIVHPIASLLLVPIVSALCLFFAVGAAGAGAEPPGYIRFVGANLIATANGEFKKWRIEKAEVDPKDPGGSVVEIEIDVASLDTDNQKRDDHLRAADFFEVEKFPTARVRVHKVRKKDGEKSENTYVATFDVKIRDVEKSLDGDFVVVSTDPPIVEGRLVLDRMDFGVGEPHSAVNPMSIGQEIPISFRAALPSG